MELALQQLRQIQSGWQTEKQQLQYESQLQSVSAHIALLHSQREGAELSALADEERAVLLEAVQKVVVDNMLLKQRMAEQQLEHLQHVHTIQHQMNAASAAPTPVAAAAVPPSVSAAAVADAAALAAAQAEVASLRAQAQLSSQTVTALTTTLSKMQTEKEKLQNECHTLRRKLESLERKQRDARAAAAASQAAAASAASAASHAMPTSGLFVHPPSPSAHSSTPLASVRNDPQPQQQQQQEALASPAGSATSPSNRVATVPASSVSAVPASVPALATAPVVASVVSASTDAAAAPPPSHALSPFELRSPSEASISSNGSDLLAAALAATAAPPAASIQQQQQQPLADDPSASSGVNSAVEELSVLSVALTPASSLPSLAVAPTQIVVPSSDAASSGPSSLMSTPQASPEEEFNPPAFHPSMSLPGSPVEVVTAPVTAGETDAAAALAPVSNASEPMMGASPPLGTTEAVGSEVERGNVSIPPTDEDGRAAALSSSLHDPAVQETVESDGTPISAAEEGAQTEEKKHDSLPQEQDQ